MATHSDDAWKAAKDTYEGGGSLEQCHRASGIPTSTIRVRAVMDQWTKDGVVAGQPPTPEQRTERTLAARQEADRKMELARGALAERLLEIGNNLLDRAEAPTTYREVKVVGQGAQMGQEVEIVDVELEAPIPKDVKELAIAFGIFVDKSQLLSGEATSRDESMERTPEQRRARVAQIRDQLQERRDLREGTA